jgi:hypothetical protein
VVVDRRVVAAAVEVLPPIRALLLAEAVELPVLLPVLLAEPETLRLSVSQRVAVAAVAAVPVV